MALLLIKGNCSTLSLSLLLANVDIKTQYLGYAAEDQYTEFNWTPFRSGIWAWRGSNAILFINEWNRELKVHNILNRDLFISDIVRQLTKNSSLYNSCHYRLNCKRKAVLLLNEKWTTFKLLVNLSDYGNINDVRYSGWLAVFFNRDSELHSNAAVLTKAYVFRLLTPSHLYLWTIVNLERLIFVHICLKWILFWSWRVSYSHAQS